MFGFLYGYCIKVTALNCTDKHTRYMLHRFTQKTLWFSEESRYTVLLKLDKASIGEGVFCHSHSDHSSTTQILFYHPGLHHLSSRMYGNSIYIHYNIHKISCLYIDLFRVAPVQCQYAVDALLYARAVKYYRQQLQLETIDYDLLSITRSTTLSTLPSMH